jgi:hypothetical protein
MHSTVMHGQASRQPAQRSPRALPTGAWICSRSSHTVARYEAAVASERQTLTPEQTRAAYQQALEGIGVHTDSWAEYTARMEAATCGARAGELSYSIDPLLRVKDPDQVAKARGYTVSAFCPERRLDIVEALFTVQ